MRKPLAALLLALSVAACADGDGPAVGQPPNSAVARFVPGGEVTVVQVTVSDRRPVRNAELVGPDGTVIQAYSIDLNRAGVAQQPAYLSGIGQPSFGTAGGGGYSSFGSAVGVAVPMGGYPAPGSYVAVSGQLQSTALIRLTDPQDYRKTWQDWKVRIQLGDPPDVSFVTVQAPQPPP
jgi:hypothetical protein